MRCSRYFSRRILVATAIVVVSAVYIIRVPEWTKSLDSSFIVYGRSAGCAHTTFAPQIAIGSFDGGSTTYRTIVNIQPSQSTSSPIFINFHTVLGPDPVFKFRSATGESQSKNFQGMLPPGGLVMIGESGDPAIPGTTGWASISGGGSIPLEFKITTTFEWRDWGTGALYSSVTAQTANSVYDCSDRLGTSGPGFQGFTIPRLSNTSAGADVAFAIANITGAPAVLTGTLYDSQGGVMASRTVVMETDAQIAQFAYEFFGLSNEPHVLAQSVIVFRGQVNDRFFPLALHYDNGLLTTVPILSPIP